MLGDVLKMLSANKIWVFLNLVYILTGLIVNSYFLNVDTYYWKKTVEVIYLEKICQKILSVN